jgi:hypothetical protein
MNGLQLSHVLCGDDMTDELMAVVADVNEIMGERKDSSGP